MNAGEIIGVDLGGTKMLVGALDADSNVLWESLDPARRELEQSA